MTNKLLYVPKEATVTVGSKVYWDPQQIEVAQGASELPVTCSKQWVSEALKLKTTPFIQGYSIMKFKEIKNED